MTQAFYDDMVFPESISLYAFKGKVIRKTQRITTDNGEETRLALWAVSLHSYDAGMVARPRAQWEEIEAFYEVVGGPAVGFKLRDVHDCTVGNGQGAFAPVSADVFAFQKRYLSGGRSVFRGIAKPKEGTVRVFRTNAASVTNEVTSGSVTIDYANGRATFGTGYLAVDDVLSWTGEFYVPVQFDGDELDWQMIDRTAAREYLIAGPSVPIRELRWEGMPYRPPDAVIPPPPGPAPIPPSGAPSLTPLSNGVASAPHAGYDGTILDFSLVVPASQGQVEFTTAGGTGELHLYINNGPIPADPATSYDYSLSPGADHDLIETAPPAATWIARMIGGAGGFTGVTITGTYGAVPPPPPPPPPLLATFDSAAFMFTGTLSNTNHTVAGGIGRGTYDFNRNGTLGKVVEFTVDILDAAAKVATSPQGSGTSSAGAYFNAAGTHRTTGSAVSVPADAWVAGDKNALLLYGPSASGATGRIAIFRNGVLIASGDIGYASGAPYTFLADAGPAGQITMNADITTMTYASAYHAFRDATVGYECTEAESWTSV